MKYDNHPAEWLSDYQTCCASLSLAYSRSLYAACSSHVGIIRQVFQLRSRRSFGLVHHLWFHVRFTPPYLVRYSVRGFLTRIYLTFFFARAAPVFVFSFPFFFGGSGDIYQDGCLYCGNIMNTKNHRRNRAPILAMMASILWVLYTVMKLVPILAMRLLIHTLLYQYK